jgi:hypothetical protein
MIVLLAALAAAAIGYYAWRYYSSRNDDAELRYDRNEVVELWDAETKKPFPMTRGDVAELKQEGEFLISEKHNKRKLMYTRPPPPGVYAP